jgi:hypothetical protein
MSDQPQQWCANCGAIKDGDPAEGPTCAACQRAVREALERRKTLAAMAGDPPARAWEKG